MASVQELLAASRNNSRASASPFLSLMEGLAQGVGQSIESAPQRQHIQLQIQAQQVAMEQAKADRLREEEAQKQMRAEMLGQANSHAQGLINGAAVKPAPVIAGAKVTFEQDEKGKVSKKTVYGDAPSGADANGAMGAKTVKAEGDLRGELQTLSKPFVLVRDSMGRIEAAAKNPTAAGDLALIFNYMKVLDPGSTVREGEFATAQNSAGLPERIRAKYNQVINGERLAEDQRADFVGRARDLYQSQAAIQKQQEEQYRQLATRMGVNPANVILNQDLPKPKEDKTSGKIRVSNGSEVLLIDAADEADAKKDGYARVK